MYSKYAATLQKWHDSLHDITFTVLVILLVIYSGSTKSKHNIPHLLLL